MPWMSLGTSKNRIPQLAGGLEPWSFMTFHILGISSSQLTNSYFSEGLKPRFNSFSPLVRFLMLRGFAMLLMI